MKNLTELKDELDTLQQEYNKLILKIDQKQKELEAVGSEKLYDFIKTSSTISVTLGTFNVKFSNYFFDDFWEILFQLGVSSKDHLQVPLSNSIMFRYDEGVSQIYCAYNDPEQRYSKDENFAIDQVFKFLFDAGFPKDRIVFNDVDAEIKSALQSYERKKAEKVRLVSALERAYKD